VNRLVIATAAAAAGLTAALVVLNARPSAQAGEPAQGAQLVGAVDITPLQREFAAIRAELAAVRQAIADPKGLRAEIAQASAAAKALDERLKELTELVHNHAKAVEPMIVALDPATRWQYKVLRSRSEAVANRWAREGWQLVTASEEWLFFKRPVTPEKKRKAKE